MSDIRLNKQVKGGGHGSDNIPMLKPDWINSFEDYQVFNFNFFHRVDMSMAISMAAPDAPIIMDA